MAADTGMKLVLLAGGLTLSNEWLQTREINWRVPVATVLAAAVASGVGKVSPAGGNHTSWVQMNKQQTHLFQRSDAPVVADAPFL